MKNIICWCKSHGLQYVIQDIICNAQRAQITFDNYPEYSVILSQLYNIARRKQWQIDTHTVTRTIWIYTAADAATIAEYNAKLERLTGYFWQLIHDGKPSQEAGKLQAQFAIDNDLIDVYMLQFGHSPTP